MFGLSSLIITQARDNISDAAKPFDSYWLHLNALGRGGWLPGFSEFYHRKFLFIS